MTSSNENVLKVEDDVYLDVKGKGSSVITLKTVDGRCQRTIGCNKRILIS